MCDARDIIQDAISKRLGGYFRDLILHFFVGTLSIAVGSAVFWLLWVEYPNDETELISQMAGIATTLVTFGFGSTLMGKVLSLRDEIRAGKEWLELYTDALGPPPHEMVFEIRERMLNWLES